MTCASDSHSSILIPPAGPPDAPDLPGGAAENTKSRGSGASLRGGATTLVLAAVSAAVRPFLVDSAIDIPDTSIVPPIRARGGPRAPACNAPPALLTSSSPSPKANTELSSSSSRIHGPPPEAVHSSSSSASIEDTPASDATGTHPNISNTAAPVARLADVADGSSVDVPTESVPWDRSEIPLTTLASAPHPLPGGRITQMPSSPPSTAPPVAHRSRDAQLLLATRLPLQSQHTRSRCGVVMTRTVRRGPPAATAMSGAILVPSDSASEAASATRAASSSVSMQSPPDSSGRRGVAPAESVSSPLGGSPTAAGARAHMTRQRTLAACPASSASASSSSSSRSPPPRLLPRLRLLRYDCGTTPEAPGNSDCSPDTTFSLVGYLATMLPQPKEQPLGPAESPTPQTTIRPSWPVITPPDPGARAQPRRAARTRS